MSFEGKIALVTGASRGIGKSIATQLGKVGAQVMGTATSEEGAKKISAYFETQGIQGRGWVLDVSSSDSVDKFFSDFNTDVGTPGILVNNAGVTRDNIILRMKENEWDEVINTNLTGIFRVTRACIKGMVKARWGRIVNIGSVVGEIGNMGQPNYCAAKAGLVGFSKSVAREIASRNITVNVVAPGFIVSDMTSGLSDTQKETLVQSIPVPRLGQPEDIAAAVKFLASEEASYITGQTLHVNGGMCMV